MEERKLQVKELLWTKLSLHEKEWVEEKTTIPTSEYSKKFPIFFSQASRHIENLPTLWESWELAKIQQLYPDFDENEWTKRNLVRVYLMLSLQDRDNRVAIKSFFGIAEMNELIALYKGLFFLENADEFASQVQEGIRTNMVNVFDAICLGNPYAAEYLDDAAWNQLILKAVFMERPLYKIQNIDKRKNKALAEMLQDYVRERWAAGRNVTPEIWRMIHGHLNADMEKIVLKKQFIDPERKAITAVLQQDPIIEKEFWDSIGKMNISKT